MLWQLDLWQLNLWQLNLGQMNLGQMDLWNDTPGLDFAHRLLANYTEFKKEIGRPKTSRSSCSALPCRPEVARGEIGDRDTGGEMRILPPGVCAIVTAKVKK